MIEPPRTPVASAPSRRATPGLDALEGIHQHRPFEALSAGQRRSAIPVELRRHYSITCINPLRRPHRAHTREEARAEGRAKRAATQGQSIFIASADHEAAGLVSGCAVGTDANVEMGTDPLVTSMGGTEFTPSWDANGNDVGFTTEFVWNDSSGATGGGVSQDSSPNPPIKTE
jgi:hypothetical protein